MTKLCRNTSKVTRGTSRVGILVCNPTTVRLVPLTPPSSSNLTHRKAPVREPEKAADLRPDSPEHALQQLDSAQTKWRTVPCQLEEYSLIPDSRHIDKDAAVDVLTNKCNFFVIRNSIVDESRRHLTVKIRDKAEAVKDRHDHRRSNHPFPELPASEHEESPHALAVIRVVTPYCFGDVRKHFESLEHLAPSVLRAPDFLQYTTQCQEASIRQKLVSRSCRSTAMVFTAKTPLVLCPSGNSAFPYWNRPIGQPSFCHCIRHRQCWPSRVP